MTNSLFKTKILIAEDDPDSRRLMEKMLEKSGYEFIATSDGLEALEALKSSDPPLLALLDWNMPGIDGIEVVRQLRNGSITKEYIYTILVTARSKKKDILNGLEVGADDYVKKPFDRAELLARIRAGERVLNLKRQLEQKNKDLKKVNDRMSKDLMIAADFQKSLLPSDLPRIGQIAIEWLYEPCDELAGDLLNVFQLDEKHMGMFLLDVSGHGVAASFLTATLSRLLTPVSVDSMISLQKEQIAQQKYASPQKIVTQLNEHFKFDENSEQYFTILYGVLDLDSLEFRFVSAGHPSPVHLKADGKAETVKVRGLPIGFSEDEKYVERSIHLASGDRLFLSSDGLKEVMDANGVIFGNNRICQAIELHADKGLRDNLKGIMEKVKDWGQNQLDDDITLLAFEVTDSVRF